MEHSIERVCDYPRPPALVASTQHLLIHAGGTRLAETHRSYRVLETFHPPTYYLPPEAFGLGRLRPAQGRSFCEWKGLASYYDVVSEHGTLPRAAWSYPAPSPDFVAIAGWVAVYPALMDGCWIDGERVQPQPGGFYGGWISAAVQGPFKGDPLHPELI